MDDLLPVNQSLIQDDMGHMFQYSPVFTKSTNPSEFWPSLVEKAYAKLHGRFELVHGGLSPHAFVELTGGIMESIS